MYHLLMIIVIVLFLALLAVNVYFRMKVLKAHKRLVENRVDFGTVHFFDTKRMEEEVLPRYPQHRKDIEDFVGNIKRSMRMASALIVLITLFGAILMYYRK